jgi:hypothetical protein
MVQRVQHEQGRPRSAELARCAVLTIGMSIYYMFTHTLTREQRKLKRRERSSSEETSFWTSVDEILVDCVAQYGDDRDRFTSGWTG